MSLGGATSRGGVTGSRVAVLIGLGWWLWAVHALPTLVAATLALLGLGAAAWLLRPRASSTGGATVGKARRFPAVGFALLVIAEIAGLNLALWLLRPPALHAYRIPAISLVVGLHFLPMLWLFGRRELVACGAAMTAGAALAAWAIQRGAASDVIGAWEGAANALILWTTAGYSLGGLRRADV